MKRSKFISIRTKIIISIGLLILFFGCIVSYTLFFETQNTLVDIKKTELLQGTINESTITNNLFLLSESLANNIASSSSTVDILSKTPHLAEIDRFRTELSLFNVRHLYSSIYIINSSGKTIVSTDKTFEGKDYSFRNYFKIAMTGQSGTDMVIGVTSKLPGFYFSSPIKNQQDQVIGVAVVKLDVKAIYAQFDNKKTDFVNYMLVGSDGMVLASNIPERVFKLVGNPSITNQEIESLKNHYGIPHISQLDYSKSFTAIKNGASPQVIDLFDTLENEHEFISVSRIGNTPYYYVTEHYENLITNKAKKPAFIILSIQLVGITITLIIVYLIVTLFLRPLKSLQSLANDISNENFDQSLPFHTNDEIYQLGNSLLEMSAKLKKSYTSLNDAVKAKTLELEQKMNELQKINSQMVGRELKMTELKKQIADLESKIHQS